MPTYFELVKQAILALGERSGSSIPAMKKYITTTHKDLDFKPHLLRMALKTGVEKGALIKVKASYKLSPDAKKKSVSIS